MIASEEVDSLTDPGEVDWPVTDHTGTIRDVGRLDDVSGDFLIASHRVYSSFGLLTDEYDPATGTASDVDLDYGFTARFTDPLKLARKIHNDLIMQISVSNWLISEKLIPDSCKIEWKLKKPPGAEPYCFVRDEVRRMLEFTGNDDRLQWLNSIIMVLSHTGMRISEAINLRWSDIDLDIGVIRVRDERYEKIPLGNRRLVKDGDSRSIPIVPKLIQHLQHHHQTRQCESVLTGRNGGQLYYNYAREAFVSKVIEPLSAEFPTTDVAKSFEHARFHSFRHFFVSENFAAACLESDIRDWLGHSSTHIVELYRHQRQDVAKENINRVDFGAV